MKQGLCLGIQSGMLTFRVSFVALLPKATTLPSRTMTHLQERESLELASARALWRQESS